MPIASISSLTGNIAEGDDGVRYAKFRVDLTEPASGKVKFHIETKSTSLSDWATPGEDFGALDRDFRIAAGKTHKIIKVPVYGDTEFEAEETFGVSLSNVRGAEITPERLDQVAYIDIGNDDINTTPTASISSLTGDIKEGDDGVRYAKFRVDLTEPASGKVKFHIETKSTSLSDWATPGEDFGALDRDFKIAAGKTHKIIKVPVYGDTEFEAEETFGVSLSNVRGAEITPERLDQVAYIDIGNDDNNTTPTASISSLTGDIKEGDDGVRYAKFRVDLTEPASGKVKFHIETKSTSLSDWATPGEDFGALDRDFKIAAGKTHKIIKVPVYGDTEFEADETFGVSLSNVRGAEITPERLDQVAYIDIGNDDFALAAIGADDFLF